MVGTRRHLTAPGASIRSALVVAVVALVAGTIGPIPAPIPGADRPAAAATVTFDDNACLRASYDESDPLLVHFTIPAGCWPGDGTTDHDWYPILVWFDSDCDVATEWEAYQWVGGGGSGTTYGCPRDHYEAADLALANPDWAPHEEIGSRPVRPYNRSFTWRYERPGRHTAVVGLHLGDWITRKYGHVTVVLPTDEPIRVERSDPNDSQVYTLTSTREATTYRWFVTELGVITAGHPRCLDAPCSAVRVRFPNAGQQSAALQIDDLSTVNKPFIVQRQDLWHHKASARDPQTVVLTAVDSSWFDSHTWTINGGVQTITSGDERCLDAACRKVEVVFPDGGHWNISLKAAHTEHDETATETDTIDVEHRLQVEVTKIDHVTNMLPSLSSPRRPPPLAWFEQPDAYLGIEATVTRDGEPMPYVNVDGTGPLKPSQFFDGTDLIACLDADPCSATADVNGVIHMVVGPLLPPDNPGPWDVTSAPERCAIVDPYTCDWTTSIRVSWGDQEVHRRPDVPTTWDEPEGITWSRLSTARQRTGATASITIDTETKLIWDDLVIGDTAFPCAGVAMHAAAAHKADLDLLVRCLQEAGEHAAEQAAERVVKRVAVVFALADLIKALGATSKVQVGDTFTFQASSLLTGDDDPRSSSFASGWVQTHRNDKVVGISRTTSVEQMADLVNDLVDANSRFFLLRSQLLSPAVTRLTSPSGISYGFDDQAEPLPFAYANQPGSEPLEVIAPILDEHGTWTIEVIGTGTGPYTLNLQAFGLANAGSIATTTAHTTPGQIDTYHLDLTDPANPTLQFVSTRTPDPENPTTPIAPTRPEDPTAPGDPGRPDVPATEGPDDEPSPPTSSEPEEQQTTPTSPRPAGPASGQDLNDTYDDAGSDPTEPRTDHRGGDQLARTGSPTSTATTIAVVLLAIGLTTSTASRRRARNT